MRQRQQRHDSAEITLADKDIAVGKYQRVVASERHHVDQIRHLAIDAVVTRINDQFDRPVGRIGLHCRYDLLMTVGDFTLRPAQNLNRSAIVFCRRTQQDAPGDPARIRAAALGPSPAAGSPARSGYRGETGECRHTRVIVNAHPTIAVTRHISPKNLANEITSGMPSATVMSTYTRDAGFRPSGEIFFQFQTRQINRHPHTRERIGTERSGIVCKDDQRDQDIFAEAMQPLAEP